MTSIDDVEEPNGGAARCFLLLLRVWTATRVCVCLSARATSLHSHVFAALDHLCGLADRQQTDRAALRPPSAAVASASRASALLAPMTDLTPEQQADIGTTTRRVEHTCTRRQPSAVTHG